MSVSRRDHLPSRYWALHPTFPLGTFLCLPTAEGDVLFRVLRRESCAARAQQHGVIVEARRVLHRAITTPQTVPRLTGLTAALRRALLQCHVALVSP